MLIVRQRQPNHLCLAGNESCIGEGDQLRFVATLAKLMMHWITDTGNRLEPTKSHGGSRL